MVDPRELDPVAAQESVVQPLTVDVEDNSGLPVNSPEHQAEVDAVNAEIVGNWTDSTVAVEGGEDENDTTEPQQ